MRTARCTLGFAVVLAGQTLSPAADQTIARVTEHMLANAARMPSYTCVETVARDYYWPAASTLPRACPILMELRRHPTPDMMLRFVMSDRLRLDVTLTREREIFSWVGARSFNDTTIDQVVHEGPIGTGAFGGFLSVIFKQDVHEFHFERNVVEQGRPLLEYSFAVPQQASNYKVRVPGSWVSAGYTGSIVVDPVAGEVVRLTVQTAELPEATRCCQISLNLNLQGVTIGSSRFLLPARALQHYVMETGEEAENTITFDGCREYRGESTVTFAPPDAAAANASAKAEEAPLRIFPNQSFTFELTTPIAALTAAAGDPIAGKLVTPLLTERRSTRARAGSRVEGHLLRVSRHHLAPVDTIVVIQLESVEIGGVKVPLACVRDWSKVFADRRKRKEILLPLPFEKNAGVFRFDGDEPVVRNFRSDWRTLPAAP